MTVVEFERRERGWSQTRLAEESGIAQPLISQIELGKLGPRQAEVERLSAALGVSAEALLYRSWADAEIARAHAG